ncbi:MAG: hypothetical protein P8X74_18300 [Reinekea sp.]|jgi:protein-tyrosine phosphatase
MKSTVVNYINNYYGSKKGLAKYYLYKWCYYLGFFRNYRIDNYRDAKRLVFVCAGNICRSPLAEAVGKAEGLNVHSFGLSTRGGDMADERAKAYGQKIGLDLSGHRTNRVEDYTYRTGDILVVMEPKHIKMYRARDKQAPIVLLGITGKNKVPYIQDPYSANECFFNRCEERIVILTKEIAEHVRC